MAVKDFKNKVITVFGDSIGKGITTDTGKPTVMDNYAVKSFEETYEIKTNNVSAFGNSLKRICERGIIDRYISGLDKTKNNVAVIELGGNDADFDWKAVAATPDFCHTSKTSPEEFSVLYKETLDKLLNAGVEVVPCTIPPVMSERYFSNVISKVADGDRVLEFFKGDVDTIYRHQEMFNNEILKNSYAKGLNIIDLRQRFLTSLQFKNLMCRDGIHPNEKGQDEIFYAARNFVTA